MEPDNCCKTCERKLYKASGALRCLEWKRFKIITRCTDYVGPHPECHFKTAWGRDYFDTLAQARSKKPFGRDSVSRLNGKP
jgi:hypothetical protein